MKEIRLNKSIELIKNSDMSISEIAFAVGFKDSGYFSKCFRKKYDQTPREYMNEWPADTCSDPQETCSAEMLICRKVWFRAPMIFSRASRINLKSPM